VVCVGGVGGGGGGGRRGRSRGVTVGKRVFIVFRPHKACDSRSGRQTWKSGRPKVKCSGQAIGGGKEKDSKGDETGREKNRVSCASLNILLRGTLADGG